MRARLHGRVRLLYGTEAMNILLCITTLFVIQFIAFSRFWKDKGLIGDHLILGFILFNICLILLSLKLYG
jgi:hypothetical protein